MSFKKGSSMLNAAQRQEILFKEANEKLASIFLSSFR